MKSFKTYSFVILALTFLSIHSFAQDSKDTRPPKEKWSLVTMKGTIKEIVKENRAITLMGSEGELTTITADPTVERFDEFSVNDIVTFDYYTYMLAEFREPTAQEIAEPAIIIAEAGTAPEGMDPAAVVGAVVKAVVTIEALNRPFMLATVQGPAGNYLTIEMEDAQLITELNIGQVIILYYAEAIAISLTKVD